MDNPQELKKALIKALVAKGDYNTVLKHLDTDEKKDKEGQMLQLIKPISAFADMLTENTQGVMMEQLETKLTDETKAEFERINSEIKTLKSDLESQVNSLLSDSRDFLTAEHLERLQATKTDLQASTEALARLYVSNELQAALPQLIEDARLTESEKEDIIDAAAISVESQLADIIGDYIAEQGITVEQINGFADAVRKLLPESRQVTWNEIVGKPEISQGGTSAVLVQRMITEALRDYTPGGGGGTGDVVGPASSTDNAIARYDGTTGKLIQDSSVFIDDAGNVGIGKASPTAMLNIEDPYALQILTKRTDKFDFVQFKRAAGTWTDITSEASISLGTVSGDVLDAIGDTFVIGKTTQFDSIYIDVGTAISTGGVFVWEYSLGGDTWGTLTATDGTATVLGSLAQDGVVSFTPPNDWVTDTQNGSASLYFVRLRVASGAFTTEPTVFLVVPGTGQSVAEVYANGGDTVPTLAVTRNGSVFVGVDPNTGTTSRLQVGGAATISGALAISGALSGVTTLATSGASTNTLSTTGFTHVGGTVLNGPAATAAIPNQNSPVVRFSAQAWNGTATRINAMDIYVNPDAEPVTNARMAFKNTTIDGLADASELMNLDSDGHLNVLGRAQSTEDMFDRVFSFISPSTWTDITLNTSSFGLITGDVLNVVGDYVYVGKEDQFNEMYFDFQTIMSAGTNRTFEYWNGSAWTALTVTDGTNNWQNDGSVTFTPPGNWATTTVNLVTDLYWVRIGTVSGTFTVEPTLRLLLPNTTAITKEVLANNEFDGATKWTTTGDWAFSTDDYTFTFSGGSGTLRQAAADFNSPLEPNTWYRFRYVVGVAAPATTLCWIGEEVATGKTYFSGSTTEVDVFFQTNSNPGDFVIYTTATATSGFRLDSVFLKKLEKGHIYASGNVRSDGVFTGNGANGIKVDSDGDVGIGTLTPTEKLDVVGNVKVSGDLTVADEVYGAGWNGSLEVPTKNAVYDIVETISGGGISDGDKGDVTVSSSGTVWTIDNNAVTNAKAAQVATATIKGRVTAGTGNVEDLTAAQVRTLLNVADGATANASDASLRDRATHTGTQTASTISDFAAAVAATAAVTANTAKVTNATHTGDVTGATALTIANDVVTNAKLANVATATIKGRVTAGTGDPEDLTATQVRTLLNVADGATANTGTVTSVAVSGSDGIEVDSGSPITASGTIALGINAATLRTHINVENGAQVNTVTPTNTVTLTNKRSQPRTSSSTSNANLTPDLSTANVFYRTTQTAALAINAPTGTPVIGETIMIYVSSVAAQTLTINAAFVPFGAAFPATTTAGKTFMLSAQFDGTNWLSLWANQV
jgi:hypothetical protein